jgi:hypothetical protein
MQVHEPPGAAPALALVSDGVIQNWMQEHAPNACTTKMAIKEKSLREQTAN